MAGSISPIFPYQKKRGSVLGLEMAWVDEGQGDPIVFLHGNPLSSYCWRNIIPHLEGLGRCIAPDLIGMGDSQKLPQSGPDSYTFFEHRRYLDALFEDLGIQENVTLVVHDWGSALGFDWARRHPGAVKAMVYFEAIAVVSSSDQSPEAARQLFQALRSAEGERLVLDQNSFIEVNLVRGIQRTLSEEEMEAYRRPFAQPGEGRRPTLSWARQLPIDGKPAEVCALVESYGRWLAQSTIPKLYIQGDPGRVQPRQHEFCLTWPAQTVVTVPGLHNLQEDSPHEIGQAIAQWMTGEG